MYESTQIIGTNQFKFALNLYESATDTIAGPIQYIHTYVNMTGLVVNGTWTHSGNEEITCVGSLGDSFAAGTTDGAGDFDFQQGSNTSHSNPYWNAIASFLASPPGNHFRKFTCSIAVAIENKLLSKEISFENSLFSIATTWLVYYLKFVEAQVECHAPKPILLYTGGIDWPAPWTPEILPLQIFQIGQLYLVGVPGEFTTMSGRRLRDTVQQALINSNVWTDDSYVDTYM